MRVSNQSHIGSHTAMTVQVTGMSTWVDFEDIIQCSFCINAALYGSRYSRMDQAKFVEDSFLKI